jgi:hypothetical protein
MKMLMTSAVIVFAALAAPVYAQGNAEPIVPPSTGGQAEPAPPETTEDVLNVPKSANEPMPEGSVARWAFTSAIQEREPVDQLSETTPENGTVYFFTELKDLDGQTVKHRWLYQGQVVAEVAFNVAGSRWRVWSSKNLPPDQLGTWTVDVVNGGDKVIASANLEHKEKAAEQPPVPLASESVMGVAAGQ